MKLAILLVSVAITPLFGQLSREQMRVDFEQLAALVAKHYAPYEWKRDALGHDAMDLRPWLQRVSQAKDDLEFLEICAEYMAALRDLHSGFFVPSDFVAEAPLFVDYYDGKPLIESIDRSVLPVRLFPVQVGDELIAVDGQPVAAWVERVSKLQSFANPSATRRWALDQIFFRVQAVLPRAHEIGETLRIEVRREATGAVETYEVPWDKSGTPVLRIGPTVTPTRSARTHGRSTSLIGRKGDLGETLTVLEQLRIRRAPAQKSTRLVGFGSVRPAFNPPQGFVQRLGARGSDVIYSGSYRADGLNIGLIRIPNFPSGSAATAMLRQIDAEVEWMKNNTDGLVLDLMRNPGGDVCLATDLAARFIPYRFRALGDELRPWLEYIRFWRDELDFATEIGFDNTTLALLEAIISDLESAYGEVRGRTGPWDICTLSLDREPVRDRDGNASAYHKPMIVLIDEFSTSSGDVLPAMLQDANRALMFGKQTAGGGGLSFETYTGFYSEATASVSFSLGTRARAVSPAGLPTTNYIENVGVLPDFDVDIMTRENLLTGGAPFVRLFTSAIVDHIRRSR